MPETTISMTRDLVAAHRQAKTWQKISLQKLFYIREQRCRLPECSKVFTVILISEKCQVAHCRNPLLQCLVQVVAEAAISDWLSDTGEDESCSGEHAAVCPQIVKELPAVGDGMFDHWALFRFFKIRHPDQPLSMGNPHWTDPAYMLGLPSDWTVNDIVPEELLRPAVEHDNAQTTDSLVHRHNQALLRPGRPHVEECVMYAPILPGLPVDGSIVAVSTMLLVPSSRGSTKVASTDPREKPISNPNYYATEVDRTALRFGVRRAMKALLGTKAGSEHFECEVPPPGMQPLTVDSSDADLDARIRAVGINHQHAMGGNAMGKVVDTQFRVVGVDGLRVVDASVFPVAIGGHPQATLYALAEKASDLILSRNAS